MLVHIAAFPWNIYVRTYFPAERLLTIKIPDKKKQNVEKEWKNSLCVLCVYVSAQDILSRSERRTKSV